MLAKILGPSFKEYDHSRKFRTPPAKHLCMYTNKYFNLPIDNGFTESWPNFRQGHETLITSDQRQHVFMAI